MRVVVDTNVFVSALLSPSGAPARLFELWEEEAFELLVSEAILAEYARVIAYPHIAKRLKLSEVAISQLVGSLRQFAFLVEPQERLHVVDDPDDDKFLACAVAGGAEYVVSGDRHLLNLVEYQSIQILSPTVFLAALSERSAE